MHEPEILVLDQRIEPAELRRLLGRFEDMVKYVELLEPALRATVREITFRLIGEGDPV